MNEKEIKALLKKWDKEWKTIIWLIWVVIALSIGLAYVLLMGFMSK